MIDIYFLIECFIHSLLHVLRITRPISQQRIAVVYTQSSLHGMIAKMDSTIKMLEEKEQAKFFS